jgi:hypothetical protein
VLDSLTLLGIWNIWIHHNAQVFDNILWSLSRLVESTKVALDLWCKVGFINRSDLDPG